MSKRAQWGQRGAAYSIRVILAEGLPRTWGSFLEMTSGGCALTEAASASPSPLDCWLTTVQAMTPVESMARAPNTSNICFLFTLAPGCLAGGDPLRQRASAQGFPAPI